MVSRFLAALVMCGSSLVWADCTAPGNAPVLPDGATASEADMLNGQAAVKDFVTETEEFLNCLDEQRAALMKNKKAKPDPGAEEATLLQYNAAVEKMQRIADAFNEQIRAFRSQGQ
jgi:hypothetical protein